MAQTEQLQLSTVAQCEQSNKTTPVDMSTLKLTGNTAQKTAAVLRDFNKKRPVGSKIRPKAIMPLGCRGNSCFSGDQDLCTSQRSGKQLDDDVSKKSRCAEQNDKDTRESDFPVVQDSFVETTKTVPLLAERLLNGKREQQAEIELAQELQECAIKHNLQYIEVDKSLYLPELTDFIRYKWNPNRIAAIDELKLSLQTVKRMMNFFMDLLVKARKERNNLITSLLPDKPDYDKKVVKINAEFAQKVNHAFSFFDGAIPMQNLVAQEMAQITSMRQDILNTFFTTEVQNSLKTRINFFLAAYRYKMEALRETYRSRSLTAKSVAKLLELSNLRDLFYVGGADPAQKRLRRHVDFGCGDGEILIQLTEMFEEQIKSEIGNQAVASLIEQMISDLISKAINNSKPVLEIDWLEKLDFIDQSRENAILKQFNRRQFERQKALNFIGIDMGNHFIERLKSKGIGAQVGDICVSPKHLSSALGIKARSVDVAYTTLTLDRARNKKNLIYNIRKALRDDGTLIIGLKGDFTSLNDGQGSKEDPIDYGSKDDWDLSSNSVTGQLDKLIPLLKKAGLTPGKIAMHPSLVICTDCVTDPNQLGYGPQKYNLVILVCRKKKREA